MSERYVLDSREPLTKRGSRGCGLAATTVTTGGPLEFIAPSLGAFALAQAPNAVDRLCSRELNLADPPEVAVIPHA